MATASTELDPCIFPDLGAAQTASLKWGTYVQTLVLPGIVQQSAALPKEFDLDGICHLAFALLLKAYVRTNDVAFGIIHGAGPEGENGRLGAAATTTIKIHLDDAATLLENLQKLSVLTRAGKGSETAKKDSPDMKKSGTQPFNTALCLTHHDPHSALIRMPPDTVLVLQIVKNRSRLVDNCAAKAILHFNTNHCDQWCAQNVVSTFESMIATVITGLQYPLSMVDLISDRDREQIRAWNAVVPPPAHLTLNESFEKVFRQNADKEAVYTSDGSFTYSQLDELSTILALRLIESGLKPNMVVPICMNKSRWVTCAMTAVWKAGGAFTAMEPAHPDERLFSIVEELRAKIVICDRAYAPRFQDLGVQILSDVEALAAIPRGSRTTIDRFNAWRMSRVSPDDLAFVVFTSGSTGKPKGILNTHKRLSTEHQWFRENMGFHKDARVLQFASYAYVPGTADNYRTLLHGATLCVPSEVERTSNLVGFINRSRSTRVLMTPSLLGTLNTEDIPGVRDLLVSGEPVSRDFEAPWSKGRRFVQIYGSTEGGTWIKETTDSISQSKGLRPASGDQWLVDPDNVDRLVPIGATGEIVLESHETSIGYLNDPMKTAHAFLESPAWANKLNTVAGCKYLRLGDLGRYESDGSITIYGRADTQVKIHGQRVDLQDIESNLRALLPTGSEAVVDLVKPIDAPNRPLLTAFCRMARIEGEHDHQSKGYQTMLAALQRGMSEILPLHMIPKVFIMAEQLPRNFSHKIDRRKLRTDAEKMGYKALAENMPNSATQGGGDLANNRERILAQSWATVLRRGLETIKRHHSFLALGGDSLAAIRLIPTVRLRGLGLTTLDVLGHPVLKDMAKLAVDIDGDEMAGDFEGGTTLSENITVALQATDFQEWAVLVGAQNGGWIDHFIYDFSGNLDVGLLQDSCKRLVAAHSILRTTFVLREHRVFMQISAETDIMFDAHHAPICEIESRSQEICARHRIRPLGASITRFDLLTTSRTRHRLIIRLSHAQYDGFAAGNVGQHLRLLYLSQPLPRTLPFHEYVKKIQEPGLVQRAENFWKDFLRRSQMTRLVKRTRAGPPFNHTLDGEIHRPISLPSLQHHGITSAALVKTAWALVLSSLSRSTDIVFGDFVSGRQVEIPGIETVFGPCVNFTPVRVQLGANLTNLELLKRVQDHLVQSIPHESLGTRHIIDRCSGWGPHARYSSIVNFINFDPSPRIVSWNNGDSSNQLKVAHIYEERQHDKTDLWLLCLRSGRGVKREPAGSSFDLFFRYSRDVYQRSAIDEIADMYCNVVLGLVTALDVTISIPHISAEDRTHLVPNVAT
ncbi:NRPS protein [Elasticomyces elasticus]|nr:NRPS protein [Elasticomyces elasticus]